MTQEQEAPPDAGELVAKLSSATTIVAYDKIEAGLNEVRGRLANIVHDVKTPAGMKAARADRWECVKLRTSLEAMRKAVKAPALRYERLVDSEAKRIQSAILQLEAPIDEAIVAEETRIAEAKAAEAEREQQRQAAILNRLDWIRSRPFDVLGKTAAAIGELLTVVEQLDISPQLYAERIDEATALRKVVADQLRDMAAKAMLHEAEAQRLADERAALEAAQAKQREEDEARARRHREEDEARERQRQADDAERAKKAKAREDFERHARACHHVFDLALSMKADEPDSVDGLKHMLDEVRRPVEAHEAADAETMRGLAEKQSHAVQHLLTAVAQRQKIDREAAEERKAAEEEAARRREAAAELMRAADPWTALDNIHTVLHAYDGALPESPAAAALVMVHAITKIVDDVLAARRAVELNPATSFWTP
jgi:hypothetical protein